MCSALHSCFKLFLQTRTHTLLSLLCSYYICLYIPNFQPVTTVFLNQEENIKQLGCHVLAFINLFSQFGSLWIQCISYARTWAEIGLTMVFKYQVELVLGMSVLFRGWAQAQLWLAQGGMFDIPNCKNYIKGCQFWGLREGTLVWC